MFLTDVAELWYVDFWSRMHLTRFRARILYNKSLATVKVPL